MSGRLVIILVSILAALIGVMMLTSPKPGVVSAGSVVPLVPAPPSTIGMIEVREQNGRYVRVGASDLWHSWLVRWGDGGKQVGVWPASESTRTSGARILSSTQVQPGPEADLSSASSVTILSHADEVLCSVDIGSQPLAGLVPVRMAGSESWGAVGLEIGDFLKPDALLMWRDPAVLPGLDASAVTISIGHNDRVVMRLRRVGPNWSLDHPVNEPADPKAVLDLLEALIGLRSERFTTEAVGQEILTATIELSSISEAERRRYSMLIDRESPVSDVSLDIVKGSKLTHIARASHVLPQGHAEILDVDATDFINKRVLQIPASEIQSYRILKFADESVVTSRRTSDGWEPQGFGDAWCALLTARDADFIKLGSSGIPPLASIELKRFGGLDLGEYQLAIDTEKNVYWIGRSNVWRGYDANIVKIDLGMGRD